MQSPHDNGNRVSLEFFDRAQRAVLDKYSKAVKDITTDIAAQGALRAPIRFGFLRASITDYPVEFGLMNGRLMLRGSVAARQPYAYIQHENSWFNHPKGGEDHYLTKPMNERAQKYKQHLAEALMNAMRTAKNTL